MSSYTYFLGGAAAGAGLMYFFDPNQGNRRRALLRDKAYKYYHRGSEQLGGKAEDLSNRAYGLYAETKSTLGLNKDETAASQAEQTNTPAMQGVA
jgi:hypothetical protein